PSWGARSHRPEGTCAMTEFDPGQRDTTRPEFCQSQRVTTPSRRFRMWEKLVTGVVVFAFVFGPVAVIPDAVSAQQCPPQQQCTPPVDPPDSPPDNPPDNLPVDGGADGNSDAGGGGGGSGGGQKQDGGQDGGRHGRDEGRPDLTA